METNSLILKVQSDSVQKASDHLETFSTAASKAERAANKFEKGGKDVSQSVGKTNAALATNTASTTANTTAKAANATAASANATANTATTTTAVGNTGATATNTAATTANATSKTVNATASGRSATASTASTAATTGNTTATAANSVAKRGATAATIGLNGATKGLIATVGTLAAPLLAVLAPLLAFQKVLSSTVELQDWQAQLKTATGSADLAAAAFERMESFASETPFALEQSVNAFVKLTNLGLTPSEEALRSYGNTASAMGKDLNQLIEAVADATTGEFERLKEFGIKAKSEGDKVTFTFRGVEKTIKKDSRAIEQYLQNIGDTEFAGAMQERMNTVGGLISNLGDSWDKLFRLVSEQGVGDIIGDGLKFALDILNGFIDEIESGAIVESIRSWTVAFEGWGDVVDDVVEAATLVWGEAMKFFNIEGEQSTIGIVDSIKLLPATIKYWIQRAGIEIEFLAGYATTAGIKIFKSVKSYLTQVWEITKTFAAAIGDSLAAGLNPFDDRDFASTFASNIESATNKAFAVVQKETRKTDREVAILNKQLEDLKEERLDGVTKIGDEFLKTADKVQLANKRAQALRDSLADIRNGGTGEITGAAAGLFSEEELEAQQRKREARAKRQADLDKKLQESANRPASAPKAKTDKPKASRSRGPSEFERLVEDLRQEEEAIEGSYLKRLELIRNNTEAGSAIQQELTAKIQKQYQEEIANFAESKISELDVARNGFSLQLDELNQFFERRKELILNNEALTEQERTELLVGLHKERNDLIRDLELERAKQGLAMLSEHFEGAAQLASSSNKKLATIGRAALVAQKAIAITQATIKTYESATSAYASLAGIPVVGPALGAAAAGAAIAAGLANVAAISSSNTSVGNFQNGGIVGGSSFSGDRLTANVNSAEMILNTAQQRRLFDLANGGGKSGGSGNVTIINQTSKEIEGEVNQSENGDLEIVVREAVKQTKSELTNEANNGGGTFVPAMQNNFNLRRTGS